MPIAGSSLAVRILFASRRGRRLRWGFGTSRGAEPVPQSAALTASSWPPAGRPGQFEATSRIQLADRRRVEPEAVVASSDAVKRGCHEAPR